MSELNKVGMHAPLHVTVQFGANGNHVDADLFVADDDYEVVQCDETHTVAGNDAGAVTGDLRKTTSGTAPNGGTSLLASTFNLKSTANTPVSKTASNGGLATTAEGRRLPRGSKLSWDFGGTLTALVGVCVTVTLKRLTFTNVR